MTLTVDLQDEALRRALAHRYELADLLGEGGMGRVWASPPDSVASRVSIPTVAPLLTATGGSIALLAAMVS